MTAPLPKKVLVVGLGQTGLSAVRYLNARGCDVRVADTRANPPGLVELRRQFSQVPVHTGAFDASVFIGVDALVVSPGVSVKTPAIAEAVGRGAELLGDVELFLRANTKPVIAITGSNGKSTVTELAAEMLRDAGQQAVAAGNIGLPVLDLLEQHDYEVAVLELSSFQLETTRSLHSAAAVVLNVSEDHMDRYDDLAAYAAAKSTVYRTASRVVLNRDDRLVMAMDIDPGAEIISFGLSCPQTMDDFGRVQVDGETWLVKGENKLLRADRMTMPGSHNQANVLAAMALVETLGVDPVAAADTAWRFGGLNHRCKLVANRKNVAWINDSKATNVGATVAALQGMTRPVVLIAGGEGKSADFTALEQPIRKHVRSLILLGRDKQLIADAVGDAADVTLVDSMEQAVVAADARAESGDIVMLSPACASLDMYRNFAARGEHFEALLQELTS
ncbi:MAG: UDP-N-acetylmuramoyl-L-alanine--D-glutamate ligase [Gammaproteobacteria bacterium]|nr:MAG: UDP-N-acetylmuramoyl-L-alanine--D-glutamate ligase [Gammaproteobacteria bacterium]